MKQPKFKFGAKVKSIHSPDVIFIVKSVEWSEDEYTYWDNDNKSDHSGIDGYSESELELIKRRNK